MFARISFLSNLKHWHALAGAALTLPLVHLTTKCQADNVSEESKQNDEGVHNRLYAAYSSKGELVPLRHIVESMKDYEVVLLGEYHDDPVAHLLELHLISEAQRVYSENMAEDHDRADPKPGRRRIMLSLEMLERDVQGVMNEWLAGQITDQDLLKDARVWPNWTSDYLPLAELARKHRIPVICANAPRRYVSIAGRWGRDFLETLPVSARQWLPPLPYSLPSAAYAKKTDEMMQYLAQAGNGETPAMRNTQVTESSSTEAGGDQETNKQKDTSSGRNIENRADEESIEQKDSSSRRNVENRADVGEAPAEQQDAQQKIAVCPHIGLSRDSNFLAAQSLWDASMAHSLAEGLKEPGEPLIIHVCGKAHIEGWMGIPEHLKYYKHDVKALVITMIPASAVLPLSEQEFAEQHLSQYGDFVILTDEGRARSFIIEHPV